MYNFIFVICNGVSFCLVLFPTLPKNFGAKLKFLFCTRELHRDGTAVKLQQNHDNGNRNDGNIVKIRTKTTVTLGLGTEITVVWGQHLRGPWQLQATQCRTGDPNYTVSQKKFPPLNSL